MDVQKDGGDAVMTAGAYRPLDDCLRMAFTELVGWISLLASSKDDQ